MKADTQTVTLAAPAAEAFAFLSEAENLPKWAVAFAHSIQRDGYHWIVRTGGGVVGLRMEVDARVLTIDYHIAPAPGVELTAFSRVLPNDGGAEYVFTQLQSPGMSDEAFAAQIHALRDELSMLQHLMRARAVCPA